MFSKKKNIICSCPILLGIIICSIVTVLIAVFVPDMEVRSAETYPTKKISELKTDSNGNLTINEDVTLEIDKDISIKALKISGNAVFKGTGKLTATSITVSGDLDLDRSIVEVNDRNAFIRIGGNFCCMSSSELTVISGKTLDDADDVVFKVTGQMSCNGKITFESKGLGIYVEGNTKKVKKRWTYACCFFGADLNIKCVSDALNTDGEIYITLSTIVINCEKNGMIGVGIYAQESRIESTCSALKDGYVNISGRTSINFSREMHVTTPENGKREYTTVNRNGYEYKTYLILDSNDKIPSKIVIEVMYETDPSKWININGQTYYWKYNKFSGYFLINNSTGKAYEDGWLEVNGKWYYFSSNGGVMFTSQYRDGYWLGDDGALVDGYYAQWKCNSTGWWYEDITGWYPASQWLMIDGYWYYFYPDGYMASSTYIDGYWVSESGAYKPY